MRVAKTVLACIGAVTIVRAILRTIDAHYRERMTDMFMQEAADVSLDMLDAFQTAHAEWHKDNGK